MKLPSINWSQFEIFVAALAFAVFGAVDLFYFNKLGHDLDIAIVLGAFASLGIRQAYAAGLNATPTPKP